MDAYGPIKEYLGKLSKKLVLGDATEHTHRSALEGLVESLVEGIAATNEPKHIECGAPDFILRKGSVTVGYIEAKDIGKSLDEAEKTDQLNRYRDSLTNLILTDYLEFRWYVDGERRLNARLGSPAKEGKIKRDKDGIQDVAELLTGFLSHKAEGVGTPRELARRMARQAHLIRNLIINAFQNEPEGGSLHTQLAAFQDNLIPDLSVEYFADMYAQTIAYGLFAARCTSKNGSSFTRLDAAQNLPRTNPFLRKLFQYIAGYDLDDRIAWLVDDLAQVLAQADMQAVLKDFGKHSGKEDPVVHFYETFLKEYDEKIREMRGVYYTPEPVVSYIVRSIDHLLKTRFNKPQGLADDKTLILDPAVGTATFLYMVINEIYQANTSKGQQGLWNNYVAEKILPRIFGFELLMAPYAVAHLKLGLLLQETGYEFQSDQRLGIYLTNTLDEAIKHSETLFAKWISEEANAAAQVKKDEPIMVVLGNPPYSVSSLNRGEWIDTLLKDYKKDLHEKKLNIDDDYIKFIRFAQWRIDQTGHGILGFITNNSYLDGLTHRRMREYLLDSFSSIYILNLHGSSRRGEQAPGKIKDENVFDIQQGVSIGIFVKEHEKAGKKVYYTDLWGTRESKYQTLFDLDFTSTNWHELTPTEPYFFFVPKDFSLEGEYHQSYSIADCFPLHHNGIGTDRDELFYNYSAKTLGSRIKSVFNNEYDEAFRDNYHIWSSSSFDLEKRLKATTFESKNIKDCLYRPFDTRKLYYDTALTSRPAFPVMRHMLKDNIALCATRQLSADEFRHVFVANCLIDRDPLSLTTRERAHIFPLYIYPAEGEMQFEGGNRRPNLNPEFIKDISGKLGLTFIEDGKGDIEQTFGPEDIFNYAYAIFHSPTYRTRYAEFLKIDFPRLPLTSDKELFKALTEKGTELVSLHLMDSPALNSFITKYVVSGSNKIEKLSYNENNQRVYINRMQYFEGVPLAVWSFHIGGYQVAHKWLKDRKGQKLTYDELIHYQKIIVALKETKRMMEEIDALIPGWPLN